MTCSREDPNLELGKSEPLNTGVNDAGSRLVIGV